MPFFTTGRAREAGRPVFFISLLVLALAAPTLRAQQPAATPAVPAKPAGPALAFTTDAGIVIYTVRAEGASDFEAFFAKVRQALWTGAKPDYERMAVSWTLQKAAEGPQSGQILYWSIMDPVVKGADYDPIKILGDVYPEEAAAMYSKLKDAIISVNRVNLQIANKLMVGCYLAGALPCYKLKRPI